MAAAAGVILAAAGSVAAVPQGSDVAARIPDHSEIRMAAHEYIRASLRDLLRLPDQIVEPRLGGPRVRITTEQTGTHAYLLFVNELRGEFPLYSAGTYILRRERSTGAVDQLKIFLRSDPRFFARIRPDGETRSVMTVYLAGYPLYERLVVPLSIDAIMTAPLEQLISVSSGRVDWALFYPDSNDSRYDALRTMVSRARGALPSLPDAEDGAMDAEGNLVFIESLIMQGQEPGFNCSGFAKWIVDGVCRPLFGHYLTISELKEKHLDLRGNRWSSANEAERDPYFGLDWTRNLATAVLSRAQGNAVHPEDADVRQVRFHTYVEDMGYPVAELQQILYLLAVAEPGTFYLGSVNQEFGAAPVLRQHIHVVVLFPYFDNDGLFRVAVMERNVETSLESLDARYGGDYIHLVRVAGTDRFAPPRISY